MIKVAKNIDMNCSEIVLPKMFWKYYDLYTRKVITLEEFVVKTGIEKDTILIYLASI